MPYAFNNPSGVAGGKCVFSPGQQALASLMGGYWTSFARQQAPAGTPSWPSFKTNSTYMVLGTPPTTAIDPWNSSSNCAFWDKLRYPPTTPAAGKR